MRVAPFRERDFFFVPFWLRHGVMSVNSCDNTGQYGVAVNDGIPTSFHSHLHVHRSVRGSAVHSQIIIIIICTLLGSIELNFEK